MTNQTLTQHGNGAGPIHKHHCTFYSKPASERCRKKGHVAYCEECDRIFNVQSHTGCNEHKYRDGYNLKYKRKSTDDEKGFGQQQGHIELVIAKNERQEKEQLARRIELDWNKDWKKEDAKKKAKEPKPNKKEKRGFGKGSAFE